MRLGILGGTYLASLLARTAAKFGIEALVYDPDPQAVARRVVQTFICAEWDDEQALRRLAESCDLLTMGDASVPLSALSRLEALGAKLAPDYSVLETALDKLALKRKLDAKLEVGRFRKVSVPTDVLDAAQEFGFPVWLKARRGGVDGRASLQIKRAADIQGALDVLQPYGELMVEAHIAYQKELSLILVRGATGDMRAYPVVEVVRRDGMCHTVLCPAGVDEATAIRATESARDAVTLLGGVGAFVVRLYELEFNEVVVADVAPCAHESALYSVEGMITSYFENHLRAVLGLPLGDAAQIAPATASISMISERAGVPNPDTLREGLQTEGVHFHLYGVPSLRVGLRAGHVNILGYSTDGAEKVGLLCLSRVHL